VERVQRLAETILTARAAGRCLDAAALPIDDGDAYAVQDVLTGHRTAAGEVQAGYKLGYTSAAMRAQMGISDPNVGPLTDAMILADGAAVPWARAPKVEPEIALVMAADVGEELSAPECRAAVAEARLALEVVDSVWCGYRFSWAQNTADGSSAAFVVVGPELDPADLAGVGVVLERNGAEMSRGDGAAAMGDPYRALAWLTGALAGRPRGLRRGDLVITGGLCPAVDLRPGDTVAAHAAGRDVRVLGPTAR
jgi:2-keto-4-pentenoate hydratase